jgi:hypothetical protein
VAGATKAGPLRLLIHYGVISLAVSVLAACTTGEPPPPRETAAVQPLPPAPKKSPSRRTIPRPPRKPSPPGPIGGGAPGAETEAQAINESEPAIPASGRAAPSPDREADWLQRLAGIPAPSRAVVSPPRASELVGLDQPAATRLFGAATERSEEPPATVWRYKTASCELDLIFYLDLRSGRMRTLSYTFKGDVADPARRQDCLQSLFAARGS